LTGLRRASGLFLTGLHRAGSLFLAGLRRASSLLLTGLRVGFALRTLKKMRRNLFTGLQDIDDFPHFARKLANMYFENDVQIELRNFGTSPNALLSHQLVPQGRQVISA
jgi:hypothetical protein